MKAPDATTLWLWRHPRLERAAGRCIGRTDLALDPRRAKRLAHRMRQTAPLHGLPRLVLTSPLRRCVDVGRWLRRWGWQHRIDAALLQMDFGHGDGQPWAALPQPAVQAWCDDFLQHHPGGGESLQALFGRAAAWQAQEPVDARVTVTHAGWMLVQRWLAEGRPLPSHAADWPTAPAYGACRTLQRITAR